jgi:ribosomal protein L29
MTITQLRKLSQKDLEAELIKARRNLLSNRLSIKMSQDKKSHVIKKEKTLVAQILTVMNELNKKTEAKSTKEETTEVKPAEEVAA